ncbi:MAG TPA: phosphoribosyltransferase family protein [Candidatus Babeliales bacterium]|nr:phosphoribosyltransferase family protein [Candidatus Babeliales bacterium]
MIKQWIFQTTDFLLRTMGYILAPPFCASCRIFLSERVPLCVACSDKILPVASSVIPITRKYSVKILAVSRYQFPLKPMIISKSHGNIVAAIQLGEIIWQKTYLQHMQFDCIIPIPLHWTRFARRGYNQADEIAKVISQKTGKPVVHCVSRQRRTVFQSSLPAEHRLKNVQDAFEVHPAYQSSIEGKHILIVDDLLTTGSTLKEVARQLIRYKPASLTAVVACRVC